MSRAEGAASRAVALQVLARVEEGGAYAPPALSAALDRSHLAPRDRALVTDLVNGTLRWQRYLDFVVDRHLSDPPPATARRALRLGAYQLLRRPDVPAYAAVSATVSAGPRRFRGLLNAVLRRVAAEDVTDPPAPPDLPTALSYPDWLVERLEDDLGPARARRALQAMNGPPPTSVRPDGYVQDLASQWVVAALGAESGETVLDLCAAPGGKATGAAASGATVVAMDRHRGRAAAMAATAAGLGADGVRVVRGDATLPPFRAGAADRVLLDAPCSGLGVLRRRADARWRVTREAPGELAERQRAMVLAAAGCVRPGGVLVYSVCTLTAIETTGVDEHLQRARPDLVAVAPAAPGPPGLPWEPWGRGALLLPDADHDGMCLFRYRREATAAR